MFSVQYSYCYGRGELIGRLVCDILSNERSPAVISAKVCSSRNEQIAFVKELPFMIQFVHTSDNLRPADADQINKIYFFVDMTCSDSRSFLASIDVAVFAHPYRWILLNENIETISLFPFLPDTNVILANEVRNDSFDIIQGNSINFSLTNGNSQ